MDAVDGIGPFFSSLLDRFLEEAEHWAAAVLESHLSYPVLSFYRSQHDNQSWLAAITCILDACALLLTVADGADRQQARLTFAMARHTIVDLALVLRRAPLNPVDDRLPLATVAKLLAALREAGVAVRDDSSTRAKLSELRNLYEPFANALAAALRLDLPVVWREDPGSYRLASIGKNMCENVARSGWNPARETARCRTSPHAETD